MGGLPPGKPPGCRSACRTPQSGPVLGGNRPLNRNFALSNSEFTHAYLASHVPLVRVEPPQPGARAWPRLGPDPDGGRLVCDRRGRAPAGQPRRSRHQPPGGRTASQPGGTGTCPPGPWPCCWWAPTSAPARCQQGPQDLRGRSIRHDDAGARGGPREGCLVPPRPWSRPQQPVVPGHGPSLPPARPADARRPSRRLCGGSGQAGREVTRRAHQRSAQAL